MVLTLVRDGSGGDDDYGNNGDGGDSNEGYDIYVMRVIT